MAYLFIASGRLGMFQRQMGVASVPYEKVISKRDMLISVLSYVSVDGCATFCLQLEVDRQSPYGTNFLNIMSLVQHYPQPVQWFY